MYAAQPDHLQQPTIDASLQQNNLLLRQQAGSVLHMGQGEHPGTQTAAFQVTSKPVMDTVPSAKHRVLIA